MASQDRRRQWAVAAAAAAVIALAGVIGARSLQPAPVRSRAPAGQTPTHYEPELGPRPGQLEEAKRAGSVPADAIDDGRGRFVSPARLTPTELQYARDAHQRRATRRPSSNSSQHTTELP